MTGSAVYQARRGAPGGVCYRVLLWEEDALPPQQLEAWRTGRRELLAAMRDAGIKGSRGRLSELAEQLRELTAQLIAAPLDACAEARSFSYARVEQLAEDLSAALSAGEGVLAYCLTSCTLSVLVELRGEEGVDAWVDRWRSASPELTWCAEPVIEALGAAEAHELQEAYRHEAGLHGQEPDVAGETGTGSQPFHHVTVLAREAVDVLRPAEGRVMVDATLGGGGHSELMLKAGATVWGIDQDPAARRAARLRLAPYGDRLHVLAGNFRNAAALLHEQGVDAVDGLLADIGISSPQVDCPERGFSFLAEGPLDMRMNPDAPVSAADIVNQAPEEELADILWRYGEERASRAIARRIVEQRAQAPITTTTQLADLIAGVLPRKGKQHPATRSFQALRIAVNDELGALDALLASGLELLKSGGRFAVITFHSLEDRAVKRFFERVTKPEIDRPEWPAPRPNPEYAARLIFKRPVVAGEEELKHNPRARSAKLRAIEKL